MKNLLGLLVVGAVIFFAMTMEDSNGESFIDKMTGEDGPAAQVQKADDVSADYADATQRRIEAEFGEGF